MTALPAAGYFTNVLRTNSEAKQAQDDLLAYLRQSSLGAAAISTLTISSGSITPTGAIHAVDTEAAASTDDLTTIAQTNTVDGQMIVLTGVAAGRITTVKHAAGGTGQILLQDDTEYALDDENHLVLRRSGTSWVEVSRNNGAVITMYCGTAGGTANALTSNPNTAIPALRAGMTFVVIAASANTSATVTHNVQSFGTKNIKKFLYTAKCALGVGDIQAGNVMIMTYDGTDMLWMNPPQFSFAAAIASAGTLVLNNATGTFGHITGTTTISTITLAQGRVFTTIFDGALQLTNGASLINLTGANITTAAGDSATWVGEASGVVRMIAYSRASGSPLASYPIVTADLPTGVLVARSVATYTTNASLTTQINVDDTIPLSTEGTQIISTTYTAKSATNRVRLTLTGYCTHTPAGSSATFILIDGTTVRSAFNTGSANYGTSFALVYEYIPGDTSSHTIAVRGGPDGTATAMRYNGLSTGRLFAGTCAVVLTIEEFAE